MPYTNTDDCAFALYGAYTLRQVDLLIEALREYRDAPNRAPMRRAEVSDLLDYTLHLQERQVPASSFACHRL